MHESDTLIMQAKFRKILGVILVSATLGVLFYAYLHYSETGLFPAIREQYLSLFVTACVGILTGLSLYYTNHALDKIITWATSFSGRFITGYIVNVLLSVTIVGGLTYLIMKTMGESFFGKGISLNDQDLFSKLVILLAVTSFIYSIIYSLLYSYKQYAFAQIDSIHQERKQLELQFETLKSQLSPHYLFNSLNTISSLIYKDPQSAEQFIRRLAQTYQYILSTQHKKFVTLREEMEFVQSYYYLLRIRFQQALTLEINLPNSIMNSHIPPLTLQLLVENVVKHNSISTDKPMFIYIAALDNTHVRVMNTKNGSLQSAASFKIGLENIKKRYAYVTPRKIDIKDADKFVVSLPVILPKVLESNLKITA